MLVPVVIDKTSSGERSYDIYSRLLEDRIVFITNEIDSNLANTVIAEMLYLESKDNAKDIQLYINSPGGVVYDGLAIIDTMNFIKCDVSCICMGIAASMASLILASGTKGKRYVLKNSRVMIHQPLIQSIGGQTTDLQIRIEEMVKIKKLGVDILEKCTTQKRETIEKDIERDHFLIADEAIIYGIADKILYERI